MFPLSEADSGDHERQPAERQQRHRPPEQARLRERGLSGCGRLRRFAGCAAVCNDEGGTLAADQNGIAGNVALHNAPFDAPSAGVVLRELVPGMAPVIPGAQRHGVVDGTVFEKLDGDLLRTRGRVAAVVPDLEHLPLRRVVGGRRDLVRRMLRRDGQVIDPCVAGFVRDRKRGQKRLGRVNVFTVRILLPDGQIQAGLHRAAPVREGEQALCIRHTAVQRRQTVGGGIRGQRLGQHPPAVAVQPRQADGIACKIAGQGEFAVGVHRGDIEQVERNAGDGPPVVLIVDRQANLLRRSDRSGGPYRRRKQGQQTEQA